MLRDLNMRIDMDDRIALLGANGNGKSTLIKLLADKLSPQSGKLIKSRKLKIGYFAQHQTEELRPDITAYDHLNTLFPMAQESRLRAQLGRFGFVQSKADTKVSDLSGGEKARLLFCLMSSGHPHLMLLDEPTNHLDVDARGALVEALNMYNGAIILVSHDPHLIRLVADRLWIIDQGTCLPYDDDLDAYERASWTRQGASGRQSSDRSAGKNSKKSRGSNGCRHGRAAPLRKKSKEAEKRINDLSRKIADIEARRRSRIFMPVVEKTLPACKKLWEARKRTGRPGIFLARNSGKSGKRYEQSMSTGWHANSHNGRVKIRVVSVGPNPYTSAPRSEANVMTSTEIILDHHLDCFSKGDLKGLLSDYTENTVLETPTGQITGLKTLRKVFASLVTEFEKENPLSTCRDGPFRGIMLIFGEPERKTMNIMLARIHSTS